MNNIDEVVRVMERFLGSQPTNGFPVLSRVTFDGEEVRPKSNGKYALDFTTPGGQGLYGEVVFVKVVNKLNDDEDYYIVKIPKEEKPENALAVSRLEFKILEELHRRNLPVPNPQFRVGEYIIMGYIAGDTLTQHVRKHGFEHRIAVPVLDSMREFRHELSDILESAFTRAERAVLMSGEAAAARKAFPDVDEAEIRRHLYTHRLLAKLGRQVPEFVRGYAEIDAFLKGQEDDTCITFDSPGNRIVNRDAPGDLRIFRFDFNQVARGFYGLDVALLFTYIGIEQAGGIERVSRYLQLEVLNESHGMHNGFTNEPLFREMRDSLRRDIDAGVPPDVYESPAFIHTLGLMHVALYHRLAMALADSVRKGDEVMQRQRRAELGMCFESAEEAYNSVSERRSDIPKMLRAVPLHYLR